MKLDRVMIAKTQKRKRQDNDYSQTLKKIWENKWSLISAARIISIRCSIKES